MKVAFDTNVLVYAEGVIAVQVLGELFNVLTRKAGKPRNDARESILGWRDSFQVVDTAFEIVIAASDLATQHHLAIWDAVILTSASHAGYRLLLSEDFHDGVTRGGTTVVNPFAPTMHVLLERLSQGHDNDG